MKKAIVILFLTLFVCELAESQNLMDVGIDWGEETKESKNTSVNGIIGYDETGYYVLKQKEGQLPSVPLKFNLEHYDLDMNRTKFIQFDDFFENKKDRVEFVILLKNQLYLFWSSPNTRNKQCLYVNTINKSNLTINKEKKLLVEPKITIKDQSYNYIFSEDTTHLLIYYGQTYGKGQRENTGLYMFNKDFNLIWNKNVTLPYKENLLDAEQYVIDSDGNVYITGLIYLSTKKNNSKEDSDFKYEIIKVTNKGENIDEYPVELNDLKVTDVIIRINEDKNIVCSGYGSEKEKYLKKACYYLVIDKDSKKNIIENVNIIGEDFDFTNEYKPKDYPEESFTCSTDELIMMDDKSSILIGEDFNSFTTSYSYSGATGYQTMYKLMFFYDDIYLIKRSSEGNLLWSTIIRKRQNTPNDEGVNSSYTRALVDSNLYFIFNDNPKNIKYYGKYAPEKFENNNSSVIMLIEVDKNGNQKRRKLTTTKEAGVFARPSVSRQISSNQLILVGQKGAKVRLGKMKFED